MAMASSNAPLAIPGFPPIYGVSVSDNTSNTFPNDIVYRKEQAYTLFFVSAVTFSISLLYYILSIVSFKLAEKAHQAGRNVQIPTIPHMIPFFSALGYLIPWNPYEFFLNMRTISNCSHPIRLRLPFINLHLNQGPENVRDLLKSKHLSGYFIYSHILYRCFGLPKNTLRVYKADTTGPFTTDNPHVEPRNRVEQLTFRSYHQFLVGSGLQPLCKRFKQHVERHCTTLQASCGPIWSDGQDFEQLFSHTLLAPSVVDSIVGTRLLEKNPDFLKELSILNDNFSGLMSGLPKFLFSRGHAARENVLSAVKDWHKWARENPDLNAIATDSEDDAAWGSKFIRDRQNFFLQMDEQNHDSCASQDLGILWAAYHNTVASVFWLVIDVFRHQDILDEVRQEARACIIGMQGGIPDFDMQRLIRLPWVQAVYAENLRLRIHGTILRKAPDTVNLNGWLIPKNEVIVTCSTPVHMNPDVWSTAERGSYPTSEFQPARWLQERNGKLKFSMDGTDGSWIPFGAGVHACPGRIFSKYQSILTLALLVTMFDIELTAKDANLQMSPKRFGFGILSPKGKISYKIRKASSEQGKEEAC